MTNTIPNVPRELLERASNLAFQTQHYPLHEELRALLSAPSPAGVDADHVEDVRAMVAAPSPAGVDGLEVVGYVSQDDIKWQGDCTLRLKPYSDYVIPLCRLSDAQAIIDGLRGENEALHDQVKVLQSDANSWQSGYDEGRRMGGKHCALTIDQQAQRIGELERALLEVAASLAWNAHGECRAIHDGPIMPSKMALDAAKAALSAGKEGE